MMVDTIAQYIDNACDHYCRTGIATGICLFCCCSIITVSECVCFWGEKKNNEQRPLKIVIYSDLAAQHLGHLD